MDYASQDSPTESLNSKNLGTKQYFLVNLSKFIVEMVGTATLGIFYLMIGDQPVGMLLGLWVIILFGEAISGAHYNPAITLVFMLRKNSTHLGSSRLKGIFYIGAQFLGGIIAAGAGFFLNRDNKNYVQPAFKITEDKDGDFSCGTNNIPAMISECTGAFVFIFLFMICTDKKTQYSDDKVINCFIMSASYTAARLMGGGGLVSTMFDAEGLKVNGEGLPDVNGELPDLYCLTNTTTRMEPVGPLLNPALALGQILLANEWSYVYIYPLMPFMGSALALVFYEFIFVRSQEYLNDDDSSKSGGDLSLDSEQIAGDINASTKVDKEEDKKEASKSETEVLLDE